MGTDILIVSPAFLLAQFASTWDFLDLLNLALQLGGTYTLSDTYTESLFESNSKTSGDILSGRDPFVTKQQLTKMTERLRGRH